MLRKIPLAALAILGHSLYLDDDETLPNMRKGLIPPEGKVWRGSTIPREHGLRWTKGVDPNAFEERYGLPLSIYKSYRSTTNVRIRDAEVKWIEEGGILKYSIQLDKYGEFADGSRDDEIINYAKAIKAVEPHQVMVLPGFEPDLYVTELRKGKPNLKYKGTPEEYRLAFRRFFDVFRDEGVENAVWALDYSWDI